MSDFQECGDSWVVPWDKQNLFRGNSGQAEWEKDLELSGLLRKEKKQGLGIGNNSQKPFIWEFFLSTKWKKLSVPLFLI